MARPLNPGIQWDTNCLSRCSREGSVAFCLPNCRSQTGRGSGTPGPLGALAAHVLPPPPLPDEGRGANHTCRGALDWWAKQSSSYVRFQSDLLMHVLPSWHHGIQCPTPFRDRPSEKRAFPHSFYLSQYLLCASSLQGAVGPFLLIPGPGGGGLCGLGN